MVLEMLAAGKITIEQANQLIEVLGEQSFPEAEQWTGHGGQGVDRKVLIQEQRGRKEAQGLPHFTFDQIIELSEHDVQPTYLRDLRDAGLTYLTIEQIIKLSEHEVGPAFLKALRDGGLTDLTFDQVIELSEREVDPAYLKALRGVSN